MSESVCLNCDTPLHGPYCHACGQKDQEKRLPLGHLLHEMAHELWHLDAKVWHTLRDLALRPGDLSQQYLAGRRTRRVPPFRLYLILTFLFFLLVSFGDPKAITFTKGGKPGTQDTVKTPSGQPVAKESAPSSGLDRFLERGAKRANENPAKAQQTLFHNFPRALFLLLPLFALLLQLCFLDKRRYFVEHVTFSLHEHAYAFLVFILMWGLSWLPGSPWLTIPLFLTIPVHAGIGLRRMYGVGSLRALVSTLALGLVYLAILTVVLVLTVMVTFAQL